MNNIGQHQPPAEPDRDVVECAIVEMLEIAQRQGIAAADFIRMLDSGMRISDFLGAMNVSTNASHAIDRQGHNSTVHSNRDVHRRDNAGSDRNGDVEFDNASGGDDQRDGPSDNTYNGHNHDQGSIESGDK